MGCDIHGVFQRYDEESKTWQDIESTYEQNRQYFLFGILAGVRGDGPPISEPRGLPEDFESVDGYHPIADLRFMDPSRRRWQEAGAPLAVDMGDHTRSWLTGEEMLAWYESADPEGVAYFFNEVARLVAEHGQIRFVFGFDN